METIDWIEYPEFTPNTNDLYVVNCQENNSTTNKLGYFDTETLSWYTDYSKETKLNGVNAFSNCRIIPYIRP